MKKKLVRTKVIFKNLKKFIIVVIKIDDDWYELNFQKKFEKFENEKIELIREELIKYRRDKFVKEQFHDDKIILIELNFTQKLKSQNQEEKRINKIDEEAKNITFMEKKTLCARLSID